MRFFKTVGLILLTLIVLPPLWFWAFPEAPRTLPAPGIRVPVASVASVAQEVAVNVLDEGSGPPVVLVHGNPGSAYDWRALTPLLNAAGLRTLSYDRVGYGRSDARLEGPFTLSANVQDLLALLDALALEDVTLVGWSYGGAIALLAADATRVGRIVLIGSGGPTSDDDVPPEVPFASKILYSDPVVGWRWRCRRCRGSCRRRSARSRSAVDLSPIGGWRIWPRRSRAGIRCRPIGARC